jgi:hypothetical protein
MHRGRTLVASEPFHQAAGLRFSLQRCLRAELNQQPTTPFGQKRQTLGEDGLAPCIVDEQIIDAFQPDWLVLHDFRHMIGTLVDVGIRHHQQHARGRTLDQTARGFEHGGAGSF